MAAKENQGLQAIVIVLTIFLLLTGVGLLLVNNSRKTAVAQVADLQKQSSDNQAVASKAQAEANTYKTWNGASEDALLESLQPEFEADQKKYGVGLPEASRGYKPMLENLYTENQTLGKNEANAKQQARELKDRLAAIEAEKEAQIKQFKDQ